MTRGRRLSFRSYPAVLVPLAFAVCSPAQPAPQGTAAFDSYVASVESRLADQHRSAETFLASVDWVRLHGAEPVVEHLTADLEAGAAGATIHHWRGTFFAPGATAAEFEQLLKNFECYPDVFAPQVVAARVLGHEGDRTQVWMRTRQRHGLSVTLDATYNVIFGELDAAHRDSTSRSTRIEQIEPGAHAFDGLLWRQNTYWSWEERDGGVAVQIESVSLTRSIPHGMGWAIGAFVERVPREELEFTLRSARAALRRTGR